MKKRNNAGKNKGFSLVELIVVVAIMAVLTAVLAPQYIKYVETSRAQKDESAVAEVIRASEISIADEVVYDELVDEDGAVVTIDEDGLVTAVSATTATTTATQLENAINSVVSPSAFTSKEFKGRSYEFAITYDSTNKTFEVEPYAVGNWSVVTP